MQLPDEYDIRARIVPAGLAIIPALALAVLSFDWQRLSLTEALIVGAVVGLFLAFGAIARRFGKSLEPKLFRDMGGKPSTIMLRHNDDSIDPVRKKKYHEFLATVLDEKTPSKRSEGADPIKADEFYERAGAWLREHTRNTEEFRILFNENITYGFWRNLNGVKPLGLVLNGLVLIISFLYWLFQPALFPSLTDKAIYSVVVIAIIHALCFIFFVNRKAAKEAARSYGRQLLLSCETLMDKYP